MLRSEERKRVVEGSEAEWMRFGDAECLDD